MRTFVTFGLVDSDIVELSDGKRIVYVTHEQACNLAQQMIKAGYKIEYGLTGFVTLYQEV